MGCFEIRTLQENRFAENSNFMLYATKRRGKAWRRSTDNYENRPVVLRLLTTITKEPALPLLERPRAEASG